jgi:Domain of unknown function (DUF5666)
MNIARTASSLLVVAAVAAAPASAAAAQFEGRIVSVNRDAKTFRIHDSERGTKRIKVTGGTTFERVNGFAGLHKDMRRIEVTAKRKNGRWVATRVERSGGGGHHGGGGDDD